MRKQDAEVREVVCSETGKPMPKIPLWMADIKVKFVSDEARQKHPTVPGIADVEPRRSIGAGEPDELKAFGAVGVADDEAEAGFEDIEAEADELADEDLEA